MTSKLIKNCASAFLLAWAVTFMSSSCKPRSFNSSNVEGTMSKPNSFVFDGHNDMPWQVFKLRNKKETLLKGLNDDDLDIAKDTRTSIAGMQTDLCRLEQGQVGAQFWSAFMVNDTQRFSPELIVSIYDHQVKRIKRLVKNHPSRLEFATNADEVIAIRKRGKIASLIGIEGGAALNNSLEKLDEYYDAGVRYLTLVHGKTLSWVDSATDEERNNGLAPFGVKVVERMNALGMIVDLSHASDKVAIQVLNMSKAPVIFSHSSARKVTNHVRNVPDDILRMLKKNNGVVMITFPCDYVRTSKSTCNSDDVIKHIDHVAKTIGIDHVGIGSDFDGDIEAPEDLKDVSGYPVLIRKLAEKGYSERDIEKVTNGNILRVLRDVAAVRKGAAAR